MEEITGRFLQLATRPLAENEAAREAAADELTSRIAHAGQDEGAIQKATVRLETKRPAPAWRLPLGTGVALASLAIVLGFLVPQHWQEARLLQPIHRRGADWKFREGLFAAMGPAGDDVPLRATYYLDRDVWMEQVAALLEEDPSDPARYRYYAQWFNPSILPPDYEKRWKELDPANALWPVNAANALAEMALESDSANKVIVNDETRFGQAMMFFHQAAGCDHARSLCPQIQARQLRSFSSDGSLKSLCMENALRGQVGTDQLWLYSLLKVIGIQADRLVAAGDKQGLETLVKDLHKVLILAAKDRSGAQDIILVSQLRTAHPLAVHCTTMGLTDEVEWLERVNDLALSSRARPVVPPDLSRQEASLNRSATTVRGVSAEELKPARLGEYAAADRFTAVFGALIGFLLLAASLIEIRRRGAGGRGLARGLMPLFRASDWAWLFGLGLAFPAAWWIGIVRLSPLGCRDIGLTHFKIMMQPWLSQSLGGLVFLLVMLVQTARWRWGKRGAFLALRAERLWIGWTMALVAALFIPVQGIVRYLPSHEMQFLLYGSAAGGIPLLWLLWQAGMGLFTPRENALGGQLTTRVLAPAWIAMSLVMLGVIPQLRKSERSWLARDELSKRDPEGTGYTMLERRRLDPIRERLLKALE